MISQLNRIHLSVDFLKGIAVLFIVEFVRGAFLLSYLPAYAADRIHLGVSAVGIAVTAHYLADTLSKSVIGYLLDHFPFRLIVQIGLVISLVGLFIIPYCHQAWQLIAASAFYGIGISPIWIVCLSNVNEENRATNMGLLYTFWLVGLGLGPVIMNFLIDLSYTLSYWLLIILLGIGWGVSTQIKHASSAKVDVMPISTQFRILGERLKAMRPLLPGMIIQTTAAGLLVPILPHFATRYLRLSYSEYSYVLMAGGISAVLMLIPMGKLSDMWGRKWFLVFGFGACAVALYSLTLSSSIYFTVLWAVVAGLSYAAVLPAWNAIMSQNVPSEEQGMGWGILSSVEGIGVIIGPILGGWFAELFNEAITVTISATLLGAIGVFYLICPFRFLQEASHKAKSS
ncbi:MFS transporter [Aneurinibacillus sp. Ricciae_BoGa-3]|uniref:MFS transporter n=1 Tax=Aneurinibacillus sp. Ricciae_BoGa-3 TaxID=3022697 RepID=UPI0023416C78|nr:MFS transporter [Aneurinibacillus sp. Ricciae_BoGa-3]WCK54910.1 MFS transporter [Aneurinibacillus sp. Ricciae_BoGa-3]